MGRKRRIAKPGDSIRIKDPAGSSAKIGDVFVVKSRVDFTFGGTVIVEGDTPWMFTRREYEIVHQDRTWPAPSAAAHATRTNAP